MKRILFAVMLLTLFTLSCSKDEVEIDPDNLLLGVWNYSEFQDNSLIFTRSDEFINDHCYRFNADGTLLERKNAGWCGTPPVSYADFTGTWTFMQDTLVKIDVGYWGGTMIYLLGIELVNDRTLKVIQYSIE